MNDKHTPTPGPWSFEDDEVYSQPAYQSICIVLGSDRGPANARLIAAAPDLLEALRESVALADKNCPTWGDQPHRTPECKAVYDKCVAAISRATSGEN